MSRTSIKVVVTPDNQVFEKDDNKIRVASVGVQGVPGPHIIEGAVDTDLETKQEGAVMAFSEDSQKWESTNELRNIKINCGSF
ncbi:hypothetical protein TW86_04050 [Halomonas sp. S2151]|uniref:hypothetical protein n=1 Tax=Halomonas sp. S2151 TaxID=579478 RepID=UPI0005F9C503|nr:hypothetical protein [Halomonas sp. S2151]KJZ17432.1 hypothetical protein TW86_04050 [Halomonas sp. S2151]